VSPGVYYYVLQIGQQRKTGKLIFVGE